MKWIYYFEIVSEYVYYGFALSLSTIISGLWLANCRKWTTTHLTIYADRIEFLRQGELVSLPNKRVLKLVLLKSFALKENTVRIKTIGTKSYVIRMENEVYNKLIDIYADRFLSGIRNRNYIVCRV